MDLEDYTIRSKGGLYVYRLKYHTTVALNDFDMHTSPNMLVQGVQLFMTINNIFNDIFCIFP